MRRMIQTVSIMRNSHLIQFMLNPLSIVWFYVS